MNITWVYPAFLLLIPLFLCLFLLRTRHHVRQQIARPKVKHLLASPTGVSKSIDPGTRARRGAGWLGLLALSLASVALARPQWGEIEQQTYERSREVIIALDLSRSMLATDVPPSRLDRAKLLLDSLINEMQGERIGLVVFAGTSFVQCPLSNDYEVLREMLKEVNPSFLPQQGTDFGKLLQTSYKAFDFSSSSDRFLIVLSDGEDLAGDWESQLAEYKKSNIHIISLGVGTTAGSVIPENGGGVIKDESGAVVLSRLDSKVLQKLAAETAGRYVEAYRWVDLPQVIAETVDQGQKGEFAKKEQVLKVERFQIPLGLALFFALLSLWRDFPVYPKHSIKKPDALGKSLDRHLRKKAATISSASALFFLMLLPLSAQLNTAQPPSTPAQPKPGEKLSGAVQTLASKDLLAPTDYAQLAQETISYGKTTQQSKGEIEMGAIDDALLGVDEGEGLDAKAADWPTLRKELEDLKKKSADQQQQKKDQQKKDQKDKNQDQKQDQKQDSGDSKDQDKDKESKDKGDQDKNQSKLDQGSEQDKKQQEQKAQDSKNQDSKNQGSKNPQPGQKGEDPQKQQQPSGGDNKPGEEKDPKTPEKPDQGKEGQEKKDENKQPQPGPGEGPEKKPEKPQTKQVGGGNSNGQKPKEDSKDAESVEMARKLDALKQKDSPGRIYQLFSPQEPSKETKGKTW